jgi:hypothetical protein
MQAPETWYYLFCFHYYFPMNTLLIDCRNEINKPRYQVAVKPFDISVILLFLRLSAIRYYSSRNACIGSELITRQAGIITDKSTIAIKLKSNIDIATPLKSGNMVTLFLSCS